MDRGNSPRAARTRAGALVAALILLLAGILTACAVSSSGTNRVAGAVQDQIEQVAPGGRGQMITAAGVTQYVECVGSGGPTVVLIGGLDVGAADAWRDVVPGIAADTRVCAIDRAGIGNSPARTKTENGPVDNATEIRAALAAAGESGPFVFVGWSYGGLVALVAAEQSLAAGQAPAGVVLLDTSWPDEYRTTDTEGWIEGGSDLDMAAAEPIIATLRLQGIPLVVMEAGYGSAEPWDLPQATTYAARSDESVLVVVPDSGHDLANDAPTAVVSAVTDAVDTARGQDALQECPEDLASVGVCITP